MQKRIQNQLVCGSVLIALVTGCSSPKHWDQHRERLTTGLTSLEGKDYANTVLEMDKLLVATNNKKAKGTYAVQRYFATSLTVRAHMAAAFDKPFMTEHAGSGRSSFSVGSGGGGTPSPICHLTAANFHGGHLLSAYDNVADKSTQIGAGENPIQLLPPALEDIGIVGSRQNVALSLVALHSRLQFQASVNKLVEGLRDLQSLAGCNGMMENAELPEAVKAWVYRGIFGYMRTSPDRTQEAFKFAVSALESSRKAPGSMDPAHLSPIVDWILHSEKFEFRCPKKDKNLVVLEATRCFTCQTPTIDFRKVDKK